MYTRAGIHLSIFLFIFCTVFATAPVTVFAQEVPPKTQEFEALAKKFKDIKSKEQFDALSKADQLEFQKFLQQANQKSTQSKVSSTSTSGSGWSLVADVVIETCTRTELSTENKSVTISCTIKNKLLNQGSIHYGVQLIKKVANVAPVIADTKVYEDVFSLSENQVVTKDFIYTPPEYLDGTYEVWVSLHTTGGLDLASYRMNSLTLSRTAKSYFEIKQSTCSFSTSSILSSSTDRTVRRIEINPNEALTGTCDVQAFSEGEVTVTPSVIVRNENIFGEVVATEDVAQEPITFKNYEVKKVTFIIPKIALSHAYVAGLTLVDQAKSTVSNQIGINYSVRGNSATIQNVLLDKDHYQEGEIAKVSLFWTTLANSSPQTEVEGITEKILLSMYGDKGVVCAKETSFDVSQMDKNQSGLKEYTLPITQTCSNPNVITIITDPSGVVLAKDNTYISSEIVPTLVAVKDTTKPSSFKLYGVLIFAGISIILGAIFLIRRKMTSPV